MSYTAFEKMRTVNYERFGKDLGPVQPPLLNNLLFLPGQSRMQDPLPPCKTTVSIPPPVFSFNALRDIMIIVLRHSRR